MINLVSAKKNKRITRAAVNNPTNTEISFCAFFFLLLRMILWKSKLLAASIPNQQVLSAAILESWLHWSLKIYTGMFSVTTHRASSILAQEDKNRHFWASSAQVNFQLKAFFVIGSTVLFSIHSSHAIPVVFLFILRRLTNYYVLLNVRQEWTLWVPTGCWFVS